MNSFDEQTIQNTIFNILKYNPYTKYSIESIQSILQYNFSNYSFKINDNNTKIINNYLESLVENGYILKFEQQYLLNKKIVNSYSYCYQPNYRQEMEISQLKQSRDEIEKIVLELINSFEDNELEFQNMISLSNKIEEKINSFSALNYQIETSELKDLIQNIQENIEVISKSNKSNCDEINILHILNKNNLLRIKEIFEKFEKFEQQIDSLKKINLEKNKQIQELKEINEEKNRQINQLKDMHSSQKKIAHQQTEKIEELERKMKEMSLKFNERLSSLEEQGKKKRFYFF